MVKQVMGHNVSNISGFKGSSELLSTAMDVHGPELCRPPRMKRNEALVAELLSILWPMCLRMKGVLVRHIPHAVHRFRANRTRHCIAMHLIEISSKFGVRSRSGCRDMRHILRTLRLASETELVM